MAILSRVLHIVELRAENDSSLQVLQGGTMATHYVAYIYFNIYI